MHTISTLPVSTFGLTGQSWTSQKNNWGINFDLPTAPLKHIYIKNCDRINLTPFQAVFSKKIIVEATPLITVEREDIMQLSSMNRNNECQANRSDNGAVDDLRSTISFGHLPV